MSLLRRALLASVRYAYWKLDAFDGDPGYQIVRSAVLAEAKHLVETQTRELIEKAKKQWDNHYAQLLAMRNGTKPPPSGLN